MKRPQNSVLTMTRQIAHYGLKKSNDPKLESNSKVRNESCSTKLVDPKTVFEPYTDPIK